MAKVYKTNSRILYNRLIAPGYFLMGIEEDGLGRSARPGQFLHIRCSDGFEPLLRRPFSIHKVEGQRSKVERVEILYEVVGKGTELLSKKKQGDFVDVLGPLGNGFTLPPSTFHLPPSTFLIAGGMGIAPLVFLGEELAKQKIKTTVLIGARTKRLILCEGDFKRLGAEVHIATDDGTYGFKGFVSELFRQRLSTINYQLSTIYACGPEPMLKSISHICKKHRITCQVSLEEHIACGLGACLGCVVKTKDGDKRVCKDGPVFEAEEILWQ